jgi:hypothetical protein
VKSVFAQLPKSTGKQIFLSPLSLARDIFWKRVTLTPTLSLGGKGEGELF